MRFFERLAYAALLIIIGAILGASWVLHELGPQIDSLGAEIMKQDNEIRLLRARIEIGRLKKK